MKQIRRILFIPFLCILIMGISSCSHILNMALIPFAPDFVPKIEMTAEGAKIYYSLSTDIKVSEDDRDDWQRDYAYYIWRSTENPYNNFKLIKRVYVSGAVGVYSGYTITEDETTYKTYDFTLPEDSPNLPEDQRLNLRYSSDGFIIDKMALNRTCYYRVSKIKLVSSHTVSDDYESLSFSLSDNTSGWLSFGGTN